MAPPSSSSLSLPSSSPFSGSGVHGMATKWRRGVESSGHQGRGFIADRGMAEPDDRWMGIKGDWRHVLASNGREWLRGRGAKETGPCPGRDPLARPYHCCRPPVAWWLRRGGKTTLWRGCG